MYEQRYSFSFEAAHELGAAKPDDPAHPYARIHGHSFAVTVALRAETLANGRWIMDFADLKALCEGVKTRLDHQFLNKIEGLETPTLERLAHWIYRELKPRAPALHQVEIARPSLNEAVSYAPSGSS